MLWHKKKIQESLRTFASFENFSEGKLLSWIKCFGRVAQSQWTKEDKWFMSNDLQSKRWIKAEQMLSVELIKWKNHVK